MAEGALDLVSCGEVQKKVRAAAMQGCRSTLMGGRMVVKMIMVNPLHLFNSLGPCGGNGGQQLGNKRLVLRFPKMCAFVCGERVVGALLGLSRIINSSRQCLDGDPTARLPLIPHLDPAFCHLVSWETSLTPVLTSSPADPEGLTRISCCPRQGGRGCERFPGGGRFTTR